MWAYDLDLWPWRSPRLSVIRVLVLCQSNKSKFWWYYDYSFLIYGPLGQHGSDWSRDLATLTFEIGGHGACGWCGSSSSIRIPSLKFVGLAIQKRWRTMCVSINELGDWPLTVWPWNWYANRIWGVEPSFQIWHSRPLGSRISSHRTWRRDWRVDKSNAYCHLPYAGGGITSSPTVAERPHSALCLWVLSSFNSTIRRAQSSVISTIFCYHRQRSSVALL